VRDDLALAGMVVTIASIEDSTSDGNECIVEIRFQCAVTVAVNDTECVRLSNGDVIWCNANECTCN